MHQIPIEIIKEHLLPCLATKEVARLSATCKRFLQVSQSRLSDDFRTQQILPWLMKYIYVHRVFEEILYIELEYRPKTHQADLVQTIKKELDEWLIQRNHRDTVLHMKKREEFRRAENPQRNPDLLVYRCQSGLSGDAYWDVAWNTFFRQPFGVIINDAITRLNRLLYENISILVDPDDPWDKNMQCSKTKAELKPKYERAKHVLISLKDRRCAQQKLKLLKTLIEEKRPNRFLCDDD